MLESLGEHRIPPNGQASFQVHHEAEIITYVREGALRYQDSEGGTGTLQAGEFQRLTCVGAIRRSEANASRNRWAHTFHIWLRGVRGKLEPSQEQKLFTRVDRRGSLCVVASPDAREGSLRLQQDISVFSSLLEPGHHLFHELVPGRGAWLHLVTGEASLGDRILTTGDGAGVVDERAVSVLARERTEVLLLDLKLPPIG
jgi:redox-sensitive bicupin YhaK (pirin superfamily)